MMTKTKTTTDKPEKELSPSIHKVRLAVLKRFGEIEGTISIKYLWTQNYLHKYRINWWIGSNITTSKMIEIDDNMQIEEITV